MLINYFRRGQLSCTKRDKTFIVLYASDNSFYIHSLSILNTRMTFLTIDPYVVSLAGIQIKPKVNPSLFDIQSILSL